MYLGSNHRKLFDLMYVIVFFFFLDFYGINAVGFFFVVTLSNAKE